MKKLYLIDGMSVVFRAYHAMSNSGLKMEDGTPSFALFAFCNIITNLLNKEEPEYISVVFDTAEPTFRHIIFDQYKANRAAFPEDLAPQMPFIKEFLDLISIPRIELPGWEADDIIGTLAQKTSDKGIDVVCITNDKDYYQLVNQHVKLYKPSPKPNEDFIKVDTLEVFNKFGVEPGQVIDVLALIGDSADNVPGVPGIGEKTAIPLIQQFGSVENIYANLDKIERKAVLAKLMEFKDLAFLSKELVTIDCDTPISETYDDLIWNQPKFSELSEFFKKVGFGTLRQKWNKYSEKFVTIEELELITAEEPVIIEDKVNYLADIKHSYHHIYQENELIELVDKLSKFKTLCLDIETSSLNRDNCDVVGISLSVEEGTAYYISTHSDVEKVDDSFDLFSTMASDKKEVKDKKSLPISVAIKHLNKIFSNPEIGKVGQNIKFDIYILKRFGAEIYPIEFDTMLASYVLNSDNLHNMTSLSKQWLNYESIAIEALIGEKKAKQISMMDIEPERIVDYACEDADVTLKLKNVLEKELNKHNMLNFATSIEFPLIDVLIEMESNGVAIDTKSLKSIDIKIIEEVKKLTEKIFYEAGSEFNIDSPKQLAHILFEKMMLPSQKKTKTGFSTDVDTLSLLADEHPIAEYVLDYRQLVKLKSTYVESLPKMINPATGRIHTTYNQTIAGTGRLSSTDPNLQNIPIRSELGKEIRKAFVHQYDNTKLLSLDYSQIELRIMAHICNDENLIKAFEEGKDIHSATAAILFDTPIENIDADKRRVAKTVNFGIMYGLGTFGLAQRLTITRKESSEIIKNYFEKYPGIKNYIDSTIKSTEKNGYAETISGRRKYFPMINASNRNLKAGAERAAINMPIQGTAADMLKIAMINIHREMQKRKFQSKMILQVHDELVFEAVINEIEEIKDLVTKLMVDALPLGRVPIEVSAGIGNNWFEAH